VALQDFDGSIEVSEIFIFEKMEEDEEERIDPTDHHTPLYRFTG
jgi:hypothetical protein